MYVNIFSGDAAGIQGAAGSFVGAILQALSTFLVGVIISFVYTWKLTLVSLIVCPMVLIAVFLEGRVMGGQGLKGKLALAKTTKIAVEAIANVRTVAGLGREKYFIQK